MEPEDFKDNESILHHPITVNTGYFTFGKNYRTKQHKVDPNANCRLSLMLMYQCWFISVINVPHQCEKLIIGETIRGRLHMGTLCFPTFL